MTLDRDPLWRKKRWDEVQPDLQLGGRFNEYIILKFLKIPRGDYLTNQYLANIIDYIRSSLTYKEVELFQAILSNYEEVLAWEFAYCSSIDPGITLL